MNNKVPVNLKLQPRRHTDTLIFTSIYLMHLIIHFLCRKLKKIYSIRKVFFKFEIYLFSTTTNKSDDWYTGSAFLELKVPVFKTGLKIQINSFTIRGHKGQDSAEARCRGVLVSESRCRGFSALEPQCRGFLVLESPCRSICTSTTSFSFSLNLLCHIINVDIWVVNWWKLFCIA